MFLKFFATIVVLATIAFTTGCADTDGVLLYCNPDDQSWIGGSMRIDLEQRMIYGGDTSSNILPFARNDYAGITWPLPLLLFDGSADLSEVQEGIVVGDTVYSLSPVEGSFGDLWLSVAKPLEAGGENERRLPATVLYSVQDGVLLISLPGLIGEKIYPGNFVPCGKKTLRYEDLRRFADRDILNNVSKSTEQKEKERS